MVNGSGRRALRAILTPVGLRRPAAGLHLGAARLNPSGLSGWSRGWLQHLNWTHGTIEVGHVTAICVFNGLTLWLKPSVCRFEARASAGGWSLTGLLCAPASLCEGVGLGPLAVSHRRVVCFRFPVRGALVPRTRRVHEHKRSSPQGVSVWHKDFPIAQVSLNFALSGTSTVSTQENRL